MQVIVESGVVSDLIETLYGTALDRALWTDALRKSAEFVGGSAASLYSKNVARQAGNGALHWNSRSDIPELGYFGEYVRNDPATACRFPFDVGQIFSVEDCMPHAEFVETRVYREWARPHRWRDCIAAILDKSATSFSLFGIFCGEEQGLVDDEMRRRMRLILPHVRRAVLIGNVLDLKGSEPLLFADTLNGLAAGVFLVDENERIVFANTSGQLMLEEAKVVCHKNGILTAVDPRSGTALKQMIAMARGGDLAVGPKGIAVPLSLPPEPWLANILPLTSGARQRFGTAHSAVTAVFVHQASLETPTSMETISRLYRLTPSERRVLAAMNEVDGVLAIAEVVGVAQATVKTHLQGLFAKTGTNRQSELIKVLAAHASPLRQVPDQ